MSNQDNVSELVQHINIKEGILGEKKFNTKMSALLRQAAAESIVLLENEGVLPLKAQSKLAVFGRSQIDYFYVGYGSGGEVNPPYLVNVIQGLEEKDLLLNKVLIKKYQTFSANNIVEDGIWGQWPRFLEEMTLSNEEVKSASEDSEIALIVIGRAAGEDRENVLEEGSYYLTHKEKQMIDQVTHYFEKVILVINSGNVIDLSWTENYAFSAILFAWQGGMESGNAIADVLMGDVNPSAKLPDTIARHYEDYPSAKQFGHEEYVEYVEDIYVGYRYFETFHPEKVIYPFGYGLSYTQFAMDSELLVNDKSVTINVSVTNIGEMPGKEVVQVYHEPPQGKLGKPKRNLIEFQKTELLQPGETENLNFEIRLQDLASYDDSGVTGHPFSYVLEAGEYQFYVGDSLINLELVGNYHLEKLLVIQKLKQIAAPVENFNRLVATLEEGQLVETYQPVTLQKESVKERVLQHLESLSEVSSEETFLDTGKTVSELIHSFSKEELDALTRGEGPMNSSFGPKGNAGMFGGTIESLRQKGIPPVITTDGPAGIRLNYYASLLPCGTAFASTWNLELLEVIGIEFGKELLDLGSDMILAPGMNIHRNPLGGRNFEYFSEDPYLTGKMAASYVIGVQSNQVAACPKHFACNNQETNRNYNDSRVSERALREIYLKGFEICVKESNPYSIMSSYNKINGVWAHYHFDLATEILRNEWKYQGCILTDWWMRMAKDPNFEHVENNAYRVRAQVDILMPGGKDFVTKESDDSLIQSLEHLDGITLKEVQHSALNVLNLIQKIKG
ncbi:glycoside hydrolase family 3 C-terminal domain-containing protein [Globicatella sulfidifaciens]|uniref:beta-glucosidase n=1 Tax=Globicatella sulfidifaciens TaxID=136093 RepID=UPI00289192B2|nr:glycoside hydrolase family 3 C-terminal domain-containing protein [Globicatella sulfidifaciens]MDT2768562.1 glycoside hydrolase family 3 C-terminal domain-containing protein [Globicatella sulfidifaciens]